MQGRSDRNRVGTSRRTRGQEARCKVCGALLCCLDENGLTIRRGDLQATMDGRFRATLVCYQPRCRTLNVLQVSPRPPS
jgi:hypothetical protein